MASDKRIIIKLVSTAGTGYFYTTTRNKALPKKLELKKFDPKASNGEGEKRGRYVIFKEEKIK